MEKANDASPDDPVNNLEQDSKEADKTSIKKITLIVLSIAVVFFLWYVSADRYTPYTDQGRIHGLITPVSPRVSGFVTKINIKLHSQVKAGDTLFQLDMRPFEIAVLKAEAGIDNAVQSMAASSASVKSSAGRLGVAKAQLDRAQRNWERVQKVLFQRLTKISRRQPTCRRLNKLHQQRPVWNELNRIWG